MLMKIKGYFSLQIGLGHITMVRLESWLHIRDNYTVLPLFGGDLQFSKRKYQSTFNFKQVGTAIGIFYIYESFISIPAIVWSILFSSKWPIGHIIYKNQRSQGKQIQKQPKQTETKERIHFNFNTLKEILFRQIRG